MITKEWAILGSYVEVLMDGSVSVPWMRPDMSSLPTGCKLVHFFCSRWLILTPLDEDEEIVISYGQHSNDKLLVECKNPYFPSLPYLIHQMDSL
jgi:hypothetical protein